MFNGWEALYFSASRAMAFKLYRMAFFLKKYFIYSAGITLALTGMAKLVSIFGHAGILDKPDPLFDLSFRYVLLGVAMFELITAIICLRTGATFLSAMLIAFLSTNFLLYRIFFALSGWHRTCGCWGNLTDALHINPNSADTAMKIVLVYLIVGSYAVLFNLWKNRGNVGRAPVNDNAT